MDRLLTKINDYTVDLEFNPYITLISGDSGVGKTLLFKYFKAKSMTNNDIEAIDASVMTIYKKENIKLYEKIRKSKYKIFIFDNADLIVDDNCQKEILLNKYNQYILFGRNGTGFMLRENNIAYLIRDMEKIF